MVGAAKISAFRAHSKCRIITVITHLDEAVHDASDPRLSERPGHSHRRTAPPCRGRFDSDIDGLAALPSSGANYHVGFFDPLSLAIGYGGGELRVLHLVDVGEQRQFLPTQALRDTTVTTQ